MRRKKRRAEYRQLKTDLRRRMRSKKNEFKQLRHEVQSERREKERSANVGRKNVGRKKRKKTIQQEIFLLERQRRAVAEGPSQVILDGGGPVPWAEGELGTGALPDFLIIGEKKCGTTFLYHLLGQHPFVQPAASKELHFFDTHFDQGVEWYRRCFPQPSWKDGQRTITGEATPYMSHHLAPQRIAEVVPQARLIALLRNPVERAYSDYQMGVRKGRENRTFEEAIVAAAQPSDEEGEARTGLANARHGLLSKGVYLDRLLRWSQFFPREQLLVLKSEDFRENPQKTLKTALEFLGLPQWEPETEELMGGKRNEGRYEEMDPATRRRLEEYFEPHNRRLYEFLGVDFGW